MRNWLSFTINIKLLGINQAYLLIILWFIHLIPNLNQTSTDGFIIPQFWIINFTLSLDLEAHPCFKCFISMRFKKSKMHINIWILKLCYKLCPLPFLFYKSKAFLMIGIRFKLLKMLWWQQTFCQFSRSWQMGESKCKWCCVIKVNMGRKSILCIVLSVW